MLLKSFANKCQVEVGLAYFGAKRQSDGEDLQVLVLSELRYSLAVALHLLILAYPFPGQDVFAPRDSTKNIQ